MIIWKSNQILVILMVVIIQLAVTILEVITNLCLNLCINRIKLVSVLVMKARLYWVESLTHLTYLMKTLVLKTKLVKPPLVSTLLIDQTCLTKNSAYLSEKTRTAWNTKFLSDDDRVVNDMPRDLVMLSLKHLLDALI